MSLSVAQWQYSMVELDMATISVALDNFRRGKEIQVYKDPSTLVGLAHKSYRD